MGTPHRQVWRPYTCACVLEQVYDLAQDGTATLQAVVPTMLCTAHAGMNGAAANAAALAECRAIGFAEAELLRRFPAALGEVDAEDGRTLVLKPGAISYSITGQGASRQVVLSLPLLSATQRTAVQSWCDSQFPNRVQVTP